MQPTEAPDAREYRGDSDPQREILDTPDQNPSELNSGELEASLMRDLQGESILMQDRGAVLRWIFEQFAIRSLHEDQGQAQELSELGLSAYERFGRTGKIEDIDQAINYWGVAVALPPDLQMDEWRRLSNLGLAYVARFRCLGDISDLKSGIDFGTQAVLLTPDCHPYKPEFLTNLGIAYRARFELLGEHSDLIKAIDFHTQGLSLAPHSHPDRPTILSNLGASYMTRFHRLGELSDLNEAIELQTEAVSLTPDSYPNKHGYLSNLGSSHVTRFRRQGELSDPTKAIKLHEQATSLTPDGHPNKPATLNNLGEAYKSRFVHLGEISDLNKAIDYQARAVSFTPDGHPDKPGYLSNLGLSYVAQFEHQGELADLDKAMESQTQAVLLTPNGHCYRPNALTNLGSSYAIRFQCLGALSDIKRAIELHEEAELLTPDGHVEKPRRISILGTSYQALFEGLGELSDVNKAIGFHTKAFSLSPDGHPDKPAVLRNLGNSYFTLFERLGEISDLNNAIECQQEAVLLTPDGHIDKPGHLSSLGISFSFRFQRLDELSDLNSAIDFQVLAVSLTPDSHPGKPERLSCLGISYETRFQRLGKDSDLTKAIESQTEAVSLSSRDHPGLPGYLNNLGNSYKVRFESTGELSDLNTWIETQAEAVSITPDGHPDKPGRLHNLGLSYEARFLRLNQSSDLQDAVSLFKWASQLRTGPSITRFYACRRWATLSLLDSKSSPLPAYQQAMSLIPQLVWIGTTIGRRYELVNTVSSFATEAASYAIATGTYDFALEWLEAGRSIVWGQIAQLRTPFENLSDRNSELAKNLAIVGRQLEHAGSRSASPLSLRTNGPNLGQEANNHVQLALRWDNLLEEIRLMPGLEDFLRAPTASQLLRAAKAHPVVIINLHKSRCDALILQPDSDTISHVALPNFSSEDAIFARSLVFSRVRDRKPGQRLIPPGPDQNSLEKLWSGMIKPVLDSLGYTRKLPAEQLPHITWCTIGLLSFLPLHTARSCDDLQPSAFDLVISSYTPTLSALLAIQSANPSSGCGVLAVGQENTPGLGSLPCTTSELAVIQGWAESGCYLQLENDEATIEQVLDAMDQFSWVHMACHGSQNPYEPTKSAFHLHDGNLTLADITKRSFTNKGLAFLSACQTATGDETMPDEAVHLAAGMLMAGYPSVIGTMWSIADEDGPKVADLVYAELLKDGKMDHTNAARALHQAVAQLREKVGVERIERWAPFIHLGI